MSGHIKRNLFGATIIAFSANLLLLGSSTSAATQINDVSNPSKYSDEVLGACVDMDDRWGAQCFDLFSNFHYSYTGRWLSSAGTGAAYGLWDAREYNAGDEYILITDSTQIQEGDWIVFGGGEYGHVGMAMGEHRDGYVALLGENQGGGRCSGGGASANIIDISLANFRGAFRPKIYIKYPKKVEPQIEPNIEEAGKSDEPELEPEKGRIIVFEEVKPLSIGIKL